jgi:hypothetical protein
MALDSGIHARMTGLEIVASDKEYLLESIHQKIIVHENHERHKQTLFLNN